MNLDEVMPPHEEITAAVAQAALERDRQARVQACAQELQKLLQRHNCALQGVFIWQGGQGRVEVQIVAR